MVSARAVRDIPVTAETRSGNRAFLSGRAGDAVAARAREGLKIKAGKRTKK
jgi:hypothetical protein